LVEWGDLDLFVCLGLRNLHALGYLKSDTVFFASTFGLTSPSEWWVRTDPSKPNYFKKEHTKKSTHAQQLFGKNLPFVRHNMTAQLFEREDSGGIFFRGGGGGGGAKKNS
jgi:hypothetical protein